MNTLSISRYIDKDNISLPDLGEFIGKNVKIIIYEDSESINKMKNNNTKKLILEFSKLIKESDKSRITVKKNINIDNLIDEGFTSLS